MADLTTEQRDGIIDHLIFNEAIWGEDDRDILEAFEDEKLTFLLNAVVPKDEDGADGDMDDEAAQRIPPTRGRGQKRRSQERDMGDSDEGEDEDFEEEDEAEERVLNTAASWLSSAPEEVRNTFRHAQRIEEAEKTKIVEELTANTAAEERRLHKDRLMHRSLDDLRSDLNMMRVNKDDDGSAGDHDTLDDDLRQTLNRSNQDERQEDVLTIPSINWDENAEKVVVHGDPSGVMAPTAQDEEDWMRRAPANIRHLVKNALAIEQREKAGLVKSLVANVQSPSEQHRLSERFMEKSIEELKDLAAIAPSPQTGKKQRRTNNYAGAAAPTGNALRGAEKDDFLPLPKVDWSAK